MTKKTFYEFLNTRKRFLMSSLLAVVITSVLVLSITTTPVYSGASEPGPLVGDFNCYSVPIGDPDTTPSDKEIPIILKDQFGKSIHFVGSFVKFCSSADKFDRTTGTEYPSPFGDNGHHFTCYQIEGKETPIQVLLTDQFGEFQTKVGQPIEVCAPALKEHGDKTFEPQIRDHWKCYEIEPHTIVNDVAMRDQFGETAIGGLVAQKLCTPTTKIHMSGEEFPPEKRAHLQCYVFDPIVKEIDSTFEDQFSVNKVDVALNNEICVEVQKEIIPMCGDGIVQPPEQCDNGNLNGKSFCDSTCNFRLANPEKVPPGVPPVISPP